MLLFGLMNCSSKVEEQTIVSTIPNSKKSVLLSKIKNKKIKEADALLVTNQYEKEDRDFLILYIDRFDCSSCLEIGIDAIQNSSNVNDYLVIVKGAYDDNSLYRQEEIEDKMIYDNTDLILDSYGFLQTPIFLKYSRKNGLQDLLIITLKSDSLEVSNFLK